MTVRQVRTYARLQGAGVLNLDWWRLDWDAARAEPISMESRHKSARDRHSNVELLALRLDSGP